MILKFGVLYIKQKYEGWNSARVWVALKEIVCYICTFYFEFNLGITARRRNKLISSKKDSMWIIVEHDICIKVRVVNLMVVMNGKLSPLCPLTGCLFVLPCYCDITTRVNAALALFLPTPTTTLRASF